MFPIKWDNNWNSITFYQEHVEYLVFRENCDFFFFFGDKNREVETE